MDYRLIRSDRKTLALQFDRAGNLVVRAPRRCSRAFIDAFVERKRPWIEAHRPQVLLRLEAREHFLIEPGMTISICGESFTVHIVPGMKPALLRGKHILVLPDGDMARHRAALRDMLRRYGKPLVQTRLDAFARTMGIHYGRLTITSARTRWGSCSAAGNIQLSVYLLLAPPEGIDYVLVHELSHRVHFDHSPAFWDLVDRYLPDYPERKRILKAFQETPFLQSLAAD